MNWRNAAEVQHTSTRDVNSILQILINKVL
jgi:hypothetical protein